MNNILDEETRYKVLSLLDNSPDISQRQLAEELGISLGKVNYCIRALVDVGCIKLCNFASSRKKMGYIYVLTPKGMSEKVQVTVQFLEIKKKQYDKLQKEILILQEKISETKN